MHDSFYIDLLVIVREEVFIGSLEQGMLIKIKSPWLENIVSYTSVLLRSL